MASNSWRYLVAFLGECHYANITPTRSLFLSCFHLSKGLGGYYLSGQSGFRVSGAPSSNKGWKGRFFYVCCVEGWSFGLRWAVRMINNIASSLNDEERKDLQRLKEILPASRVIRNMTEQWLVEAGLSPTPREMVNLVAVRGGRASPVVSPRRPTERRIGLRDTPVELEAEGEDRRTRRRISQGEPLLYRPGAIGEGASVGARPARVGRMRGRHLGSLPFASCAAFQRERRASLTKPGRWANSRRANPLTRWWPAGRG
ncbi:hypothetical protein C4D60_Mb04t13720 [Musa balbisiana]|uniref:Uncharacterized protein n=1 Tax=Musa balbisiana TaxID=52838 RepID=A0A4S8KBU0_MUSBA|nr:hypothetical protein C4D60_Mb04t13720 [Musa balbisiana]